MDLGKFLHVLAKDCHIAKAFGSVPPPNDTIWKAARKKNFDVKTFQRSGSGREKELDVAMAHDITKTLLCLDTTDHIRFIAVTGDRDLKPPLEYVLETKVPIDLWSWEDSMACEYSRLANTNDLFTVHKLDTVQAQFGYTAIMSTRKKRDIDPAHAIAYVDVPRGKRFVYSLAGYIAQLMRLFYITSNDFVKEGKQDLIIEFPNTTPEVVLKQLSRHGKSAYQPMSYPQYMSQLQKESKPVLSSTIYKAIGEIDDDLIHNVADSFDIEDLASGGQSASIKRSVRFYRCFYRCFELSACW